MSSELRFNMLRWQREVFADKTRFKVVVAGRRCGKTYMSAIDLIAKTLECPDRLARVMYVAPTQSMAHDLMWDLSHELARPVILKSNVNDGNIVLVNGVTLQLRGADKPDRLRGKKLFHVVLDEMKDMKDEVWELNVAPSLSDMEGSALFIGTPEPGDSVFRDLYEQGLGGNEEFKSWHFTTLDNETMNPKEIESAKKRLSTIAFQQEYMASFETMGENIFKESWLKYSDEPPKQGNTYIAVDPAGFENVADQNKKKHLDNTAICVVIADDKGKWWVRKIEYGRWDTRETATRILMAIRTHKPMQVGIEKGSLQRALQPYLEDLMRKNNVFAHIEAISIGGGSKTNRITYNLQGMFEHGRIELNSREDWTQFKKEYVSFPSPKSHDDLVDSLSLVANLITTSYAKDNDVGEEVEIFDEVVGY